MNWSGYILNPMGYTLRKIPAHELYEFTLDARNPLTYRLLDGTMITPNKHMITDMASIPLILQWIPCFQKDRYIAPLFHDSAYKDKGIWADGKFYPMSRAEADALLFEILDSENAKVVKYAYWLAVRIGGGFSWNKGKVKV